MNREARATSSIGSNVSASQETTFGMGTDLSQMTWISLGICLLAFR